MLTRKRRLLRRQRAAKRDRRSRQGRRKRAKRGKETAVETRQKASAKRKRRAMWVAQRKAKATPLKTTTLIGRRKRQRTLKRKGLALCLPPARERQSASKTRLRHYIHTQRNQAWWPDPARRVSQRARPERPGIEGKRELYSKHRQTKGVSASRHLPPRQV